ncbi:hypothetical protein ANO11243_023750 [Dothideomycetidae sp. 11243]|nr:hypothetical protein ANO11243_023750 [fungal sp. No.11243]
MPDPGLIDYSPHQPSPAAPLATATNLILIDNYDSFTWNVYQYLVLEGANVTVFRNDEISLARLVELQPSQLVVSPGPGHPETDSGISKDAIRHFAGKVPILGVCMGEQCIFSVFGGRVEQTGEILHGKTSPLRHDSRGVYAGLPQDLPVTRYHSLAGTHPTLPPCLEVTSWIATGPDGGKGVIMGVRHREFTIEGVQFHPESILTAEGRRMTQNFLQMQGGTWEDDKKLRQAPSNAAVSTNGVAAGVKSSNILDRIYAHRRAAVATQKLIPSQRPEDLQRAYDLDLAPPIITFPDRLRQSPYPLSLMAEIKRASPSKGIISISACAPSQARTYAQAGASVISVLTEPEWFKGSIEDLRHVRQALNGMPQRPAILRKEFVFEEYQILEARLAGADTVLLIVKMLDLETLTRLYNYSKSLGMEPLVEVNTVEEMEVAISLGSQVIGVNNRNLTNFEVDMETTSRLMNMVPKETIVCALSGISGPSDVKPYLANGVGAVLVGEALMRAQNTAAFIADLLCGKSTDVERKTQNRSLVKICGTRSAEVAKAAVDAGADLVGIILVKGRSRYVHPEIAREISEVVHNTTRPLHHKVRPSEDNALSPSFFQFTTNRLLQRADRALLVGVFQNQPLEYILEQCHLLDLDIVQLHGKEPIEWATIIPVPVIRAFHVNDPGLGSRGFHAVPLIDSASGGSGEPVDVKEVLEILRRSPDLRIMLAGGLTPDNVSSTLSAFTSTLPQIAIVDVSSGVEENGKQSIPKIQKFIQAAKLVVA